MRSVDITPTWRAAMTILMAVLENGTEAGRAAARTELMALAAKLDAHPLLNVSDTEHAAILTGLRLYQDVLKGNPSLPDDVTEALADLATRGGEIEGITDDGIDALCERINFASTSTVAHTAGTEG